MTQSFKILTCFALLKPGSIQNPTFQTLTVRWKYGVKSGRGKGVAVYSKESLIDLEFIEEPDFQAIHGKNVSIGSFIVVYVQNQEKPWLRMTQRLSQRWLECQFIAGDFNVLPDDNNPLFKLLDSQELC